jgi:protocatechuate 3,4-dioxygenase alpha subunit
VTPEPTPSQTVGPFFHDALLAENQTQLVSPDHPSAIRISGTIYDGAGAPVPDAMLEIWQADTDGQYSRPGDEFPGFGRSGTDADGRFGFVTVKPGPVVGPYGGFQAPHIAVSIFARGLLKHLVTRIYFPEEEEANASDTVLASVEDPEFRDMLVARARDDGYMFDVHLQGEKQTVFFDI